MITDLPADELRVDEPGNPQPTTLHAEAAPWLVRVRHGRVRHVWALHHAQNPPAVIDASDADYLVDASDAAPPAVGAAVDPRALGWVPTDRVG